MANYFPEKLNQVVTLNRDLRNAAWEQASNLLSAASGQFPPQEPQPQQAPAPGWDSSWTRLLQQRGQVK